MFKRTALVSLLAVGLAGGAWSLVRAADNDEKQEKQEVMVKIDQAPAAVQQTIKEESGGAVVAEVEKEDKDGKTCYEAKVQIKGKDYEIKVAEDGTLMKKAAGQRQG